MSMKVPSHDGRLPSDRFTLGNSGLDQVTGEQAPFRRIVGMAIKIEETPATRPARILDEALYPDGVPARQRAGSSQAPGATKRANQGFAIGVQVAKLD